MEENQNCLNCKYEPTWSRVKRHESFVGVCKWEPNDDMNIALGYKLYPELVYKTFPHIKCHCWEAKVEGDCEP